MLASWQVTRILYVMSTTGDSPVAFSCECRQDKTQKSKEVTCFSSKETSLDHCRSLSKNKNEICQGRLEMTTWKSNQTFF